MTNTLNHEETPFDKRLLKGIKGLAIFGVLCFSLIYFPNLKKHPFTDKIDNLRDTCTHYIAQSEISKNKHTSAVDKSINELKVQKDKIKKYHWYFFDTPDHDESKIDSNKNIIFSWLNPPVKPPNSRDKKKDNKIEVEGLRNNQTATITLTTEYLQVEIFDGYGMKEFEVSYEYFDETNRKKRKIEKIQVKTQVKTLIPREVQNFNAMIWLKSGAHYICQLELGKQDYPCR